MKIYIFCLVSLLCCSLAAQTNVSGGINSDTDWTKENSPYIITGNTVVFGTNTLTIEAGVEVRFEDDVELRIQGSIIALGSEDEEILFTSNSSTPQMGSWKEIELEFEAVGLFEYVKIEYAESGLRYNFIDTSSRVKYATFQHNMNGIQVDSGRGQFPITIESVIFSENDTGIKNFHDEVHLLSCEVVNNRVGVELIESNIESCLFKGNTEIGLEGHTSIVQNSTFLENGIGLKQSFSGGSEASVMTGNTIKDNNIGLVITGNSPVATFSNNTICNNTTLNVQNTSTYSGQDLSGNCWCTEDETEIEDSIFHGLDDVDFGVVIFLPLSDTECPDTTLSTYEVDPNTTLGFYPNPVAYELFFKDDEEKQYEIFSMNGVSLRKGKTTDKLDLSELQKGVYLIKIIYASKRVISAKLLKS